MMREFEKITQVHAHTQTRTHPMLGDDDSRELIQIFILLDGLQELLQGSRRELDDVLEVGHFQIADRRADVDHRLQHLLRLRTGHGLVREEISCALVTVVSSGKLRREGIQSQTGGSNIPL